MKKRYFSFVPGVSCIPSIVTIVNAKVDFNRKAYHTDGTTLSSNYINKAYCSYCIRVQKTLEALEMNLNESITLLSNLVNEYIVISTSLNELLSLCDKEIKIRTTIKQKKEELANTSSKIEAEYSKVLSELGKADTFENNAFLKLRKQIELYSLTVSRAASSNTVYKPYLVQISVSMRFKDNHFELIKLIDSII